MDFWAVQTEMWCSHISLNCLRGTKPQYSGCRSYPNVVRSSSSSDPSVVWIFALDAYYFYHGMLLWWIAWMALILHPPNGHILYNMTLQVLQLKRSDVYPPLTLGLATWLALVLELLGVKWLPFISLTFPILCCKILWVPTMHHTLLPNILSRIHTPTTLPGLLFFLGDTDSFFNQPSVKNHLLQQVFCHLTSHVPHYPSGQPSLPALVALSSNSWLFLPMNSGKQRYIFSIPHVHHSSWHVGGKPTTFSLFPFVCHLPRSQIRFELC